MNIFKTFTLRWWQAGVLKISLLSLGIIIGATWSDILYPWRMVLLLVFVLSTASIFYIWWKQ